jgi:hypothetical protein
MPHRDGTTTVKRDPGRPPDDPYFKASRPQRALVSRATEVVIEKSQKMHGLNQTDYVRWCIIQQLQRDGLAGQLEFEKDNTWQSLLEKGLI